MRDGLRSSRSCGGRNVDRTPLPLWSVKRAACACSVSFYLLLPWHIEHPPVGEVGGVRSPLVLVDVRLTGSVLCPFLHTAKDPAVLFQKLTRRKSRGIVCPCTSWRYDYSNARRDRGPPADPRRLVAQPASRALPTTALVAQWQSSRHISGRPQVRSRAGGTTHMDP